MAFDNEASSIAWGDFSDGSVPLVPEVCVECSEGFAIPFGNKGADEPSELDKLLGLDSTTVTLDWYLNCDYRNSVSIQYLRPNFEDLDHQDTFVDRVFKELSKMCTVDELSEIYTYIGAFNFICVDDYVTSGQYESNGVLFMSSEYGFFTPSIKYHQNQRNEMTWYFNDNFTFTKDSFGKDIIRYTYSDYATAYDESREYYETTIWSVNGRFDAKRAAEYFLKNYRKQKDKDEWWENFWAGVDITLAVLSVVPIAGQFIMAARGTMAAVRYAKYAFYAVESLLTVDSFYGGTTQLIGGKRVSLGKDLFVALGKLADPVNGAKRGEQVFLMVNLSLLTPLAFGSVKRAYSSLGRNASEAKFTQTVVNESHHAEMPPNPNVAKSPEVSVPSQGIPVALRTETNITKLNVDGSVQSIKATSTPSLESVNTYVTIIDDSTKARANIALKAESLKAQLVSMLGLLGRGGKLNNFVGRAGEAHFRKYLVENLGVDPKNVLGALENSSGHGLDLIIRVPPPPTMTRRVPQSNAERHSKIGAKADYQNMQETVDFSKLKEGEQVIVFEIKSTMGEVTPGFNKSTQGQGGAKNVQRVVDYIEGEKAFYKPHNLINSTPNYAELKKILEDAILTNRIDYMHAQVFFNNQGRINNLVGGGTGIQVNNWK